MNTNGLNDHLSVLSRALPVILCLCLPGCRDPESLAKIARLEEQRAKLEQQLAREKELRRMAEDANAVIENKVYEANARSAEREKSLREHLKLAERLKSKLRTAAVGEELPQLATTSGKVYANAKILQVSDGDLTVAHSGGVTVIPYGDLPEKLVERFEMVDRCNPASGHSTEVPPPVKRWIVWLLLLGLVLCAYSIFCATGKARPIWVLLPIAVIGACLLWFCLALLVGGAAHQAEDNLFGDSGHTVSIGGGESRILRESSK